MSSRGSTDRRQVTLRAPLEFNAETLVVREYFKAVLEHDIDALQEKLAPRATFGRDAQSQPRDALAVWRERLQKLNYTWLSPTLPYIESTLEVYEPNQLERLGRQRGFPMLPREGERVVRVELTRLHGSGPSLFAEEVFFLLRPHPGGFQIAHIVEDFQLP